MGKDVSRSGFRVKSRVHSSKPIVLVIIYGFKPIPNFWFQVLRLGLLHWQSGKTRNVEHGIRNDRPNITANQKRRGTRNKFKME